MIKNFKQFVNESKIKEVPIYTIKFIKSQNKNQRESFVTDTLQNLIKYFSAPLGIGKLYEREKNNSKINMNPKNVHSLIDNLNNANANVIAITTIDMLTSSTSYYLVDNSENLKFNKEEKIYKENN